VACDLLGGTCTYVIADLLVVIPTVNSDGLNKSQVFCASPSAYLFALAVCLSLPCILLPIMLVSESHLNIPKIDLSKPIVSVNSDCSSHVILGRNSSFGFPLHRFRF